MRIKKTTDNYLLSGVFKAQIICDMQIELNRSAVVNTKHDPPPILYTQC